MSRAPFTREQRERLSREVQYRVFGLERAALDEEARTLPASLSSEMPVRRWFGNEILVHDASAIDLSRAIDGRFPLLDSHDTGTLIGAVEGIRVDSDKKTRGTLRFSEATTAPHVYAQVREGMPLGISIGYRIDEWTESADSDDVTVTRWTLLEVSMVTVPADTSVGPNRSLEKEDPAMPDNQPADTPAPTPAESPALAAAAHVRAVRAESEAAGAMKERARVASIRELFTLPGFAAPEFLAFERDAIESAMSVEQVREQLLVMVGAGVQPAVTVPAYQRQAPMFAGPSAAYQPPAQMPRVQAGRDQLDGFREAAIASISVRANLIKDREEQRKALDGNECNGLSMMELARECLRRSNIDTRGMSPVQIVGLAFTAQPSFVRSGAPAHGVSDFANILLDAANKSLMGGWTENPETFSAWTRSMNLSDFKVNNLINRSNFGDLDVVPEQADYKYGTFSDVKETIQLRTYGKLFSISRQAIINDDLGAFTEIPMLMGRAAARMVGDEAYGVLTTNAALNQDSLALFHATHGNYVSTGGSAPSVTSLDACFTAMATRTDPSGATINVVPRFIIVPRALEATARTLSAATYDPSGSAGTLKPNAFQGRFDVVADARLDTFNSAGWFAAADPILQPTVIVGYLNGQQTPYLEQKDAWSQDGVSFKVRMDCRAAAADFRGLYYNDGA